MRRRVLLAVAAWVLERFAAGPYGEAISGDLLEEMAGGRSAGWYCRQVVWAAGLGLCSRCRGYAGMFAFSAVWGLLYPVTVLPAMRAFAVQGWLGRCSSMDWPISALGGVSSVFLPPALFLWAGFFVYFVVLAEPAERPGSLRVLGSLSLGLNVLLVATVGLMGLGVLPGEHPAPMGVAIYAEASYRLASCVPVMLSLPAALLCGLGRPRGSAGAGSDARLRFSRT